MATSSQNRKLSLYNIVVMIAVGLLGILVLYIMAQGLITGEIREYQRGGTPSFVSRLQNPLRLWSSFFVYFLIIAICGRVFYSNVSKEKESSDRERQVALAIDLYENPEKYKTRAAGNAPLPTWLTASVIAVLLFCVAYAIRQASA